MYELLGVLNLLGVQWRVPTGRVYELLGVLNLLGEYSV